MVVGSVYMFAGSTAPSGFLVCDGSAVSRATYSDLFSVIGTTYGSGDGSSTFNLPDLSGRLSIGSSSNHIIGSTGGEEQHALSINEVPVHLHEVPTHGHANNITATTPALAHTVTQPVFKYNPPAGAANCNSGSSQTAYSGSSSATASNYTNTAIANHTGSCTVQGGVLDAQAMNSGSTGSGNSHSNMQPFITMNYIVYAGDVA